MGRLDKWTKFHILRGSSALSSALPETHSFSETMLWRMMEKYTQVILKPKEGKGGTGVIQLSRRGDSSYHVHCGALQKMIKGRKEASQFIRRKMESGPYIIQRRISLAKVGDRPFDLRVMVQRRRNSPWLITGRLAKVAGKGYFVTNILRSKGTVLPVETAISRSSLKYLDRHALFSQIDSIALKTAKQLAGSYRWLRTVGLDMGLDHQGKVWIIEANFTPAECLFLRLKDKSMYRRIMSFKNSR